MANTFTWKGGSGLLSDADNWVDQTSGTAGPPTTADKADFRTLGAATLSGTGIAQVAQFGSNSGPWTVTGTLTLTGRPNADPFLPFALIASGTLTVDGGSIEAAGGTVSILDSSGSTLTAENGATVTTLGTNVGFTGQPGTLTLTGAATTWSDLSNPTLDTRSSTSGYTTIGGGTGTGTLTVTAGASLTTARYATIGDQDGASGTARVSDGGSWATESLNVGQHDGSKGDLTVSGGTVTVSGGDGIKTGFLTIGHYAGSVGTVTVSAGGVLKNAQADQTSATPGYLTNIGFEGTGTVTVTGTGSLLDTGRNGLALGLGTTDGSGTLNVSQGGAVRTATFNNAGIGALSVGKVGVGSITVSDAGSTLIASGFAGFGRGGVGHLVVENDASFTGGDATTLFPLLIGSGGSSGGAGGAGTVGWLYGGSGDAIVRSGGLLSSTYRLIIGNGGDTGLLTVSDRGVASAADLIAIGAGQTYAGTVSCRNATDFTNGTETPVTSGTNFAGTGTVDVNAGGTLKSTAVASNVANVTNLVLGAQAESVGTLDAAGVGALVDSGANNFTVGYIGSGTATFANNAVLTAGTGDTTHAALYVGRSATGVGTLDIASGATATATGEVVVGSRGHGTLTVESGGTLNSGNNPNFTTQGFVVAVTSGSQGDATVTGTGSRIVNTGEFLVGGAGLGTLAIKDGGVVTTGNDASVSGAVIADSAGSDGSKVTLDGTGSAWTITGALVVGQGAKGTLSVGSGGTVTASSITVGTLGEIDALGGTVDPPGDLTNSGLLTGAGLFDEAIVNDGTIDAFAAGGATVLEVTGAVSGTGGIAIENSGDFQADAAVGAGQTVTLKDGTAALTIKQLSSFAAPVSGFRLGDVIHVTGVDAGSLSGSTLTLTSHGIAAGTLALTGIAGALLDPAALAVSGDGDVTLCMLAGTRIRTPEGERPVEALREGDPVLTASGGTRPVAWVGWRQGDAARHPRPAEILPIRIAAGAFGAAQPARDLWLSPDHAVFVEDVLIPIKYLVNGGTVRADPSITRPRYFHVELDEHDVLLAEGLAVESLLPGADRANFANGGVRMRLHPDFHSLAREALACARLVVTGPPVEAARARLAAGASARSHAGSPPLALQDARQA